MKLAIRNATVLDGRGNLQRRATVLVEKAHILAVGTSRDVNVPRGARVIDAAGMTVLPGLIDCHVHLSLGGEPDVVRTIQDEHPAFTLLKAVRFARETLDAGFTTVRDLGSRDHSIFDLKRAIDGGIVPGPRILPAGLAICMTGGHARFIGRQADGPDEVVKAVREQLAAGAEAIKFIASGGVLTTGTSPHSAQMTIEELSAGIAEARRSGRRVAAHAHSAEGMKNAIRAGAHSVEHATLMDEDAAGLMRERGVFMVPTLSALAMTDRGLGCGIPEPIVQKAQAMRARHEGSFKKAHQSAIPIAMGTDAGTPFNHHGENAQELERMVTLGMTPMDAVRAATDQAAILLGIQDSVGTVEAGKIADLVVIEGDPLKNIELLRDRSRIAGVMQAGRFVAGPLKTETSAAG